MNVHETRDSSAPWWNIANVITMARIAMVPFFLAALLIPDGVVWRLVALVIFLVAAITDRLDGYLARSRGLVTNLGKILDPIADKVLTGGALVALSWLGELPWWVTVVILGREFAITMMRFIVIRIAVLPASRGGKLKTVTQIVAISLWLLPLTSLPGFVTVVAWIAMGGAVVVTVVTGVEYLVHGVRVARNGRGPEGGDRS
ncbi:CDP-diacylglycerol/glycerol-3-phosphate 3- phosphatidyltransferase [Jonesia denitrificans DSM 20603]|uniref:CDP-diacylglycerol--glycerol-3-phosphate 3-phosphatidyltransferase n=2 Tax=Jonesia TaxID=43673 RepID=C7R3F5_JONDD|nr:CDP-diacylglycerol--glycerol-3-phosphate 3-phosphatidyltransferase [Jonesia denitrificans]ACV08691.1 CDP-diacylglycerol/glycerol-3-phosphate 3- phosphatidyltransferase [Jonesia denitrificans DSM 20603]